MRSKDTPVAELPARITEAPPRTASVQLTTIASMAADGTPEVIVDNGRSPVRARLAVRAPRSRIETAIVLRQPVVVAFEDDDRLRPLILGFIETVEPEPAEDRAGSPAVVADVDGKRVRVMAQDEIVLECGSASITLRRNGRVVIRGTYVETRSDGTNRIKGGQVQIN